MNYWRSVGCLQSDMIAIFSTCVLGIRLIIELQSYGQKDVGQKGSRNSSAQHFSAPNRPCFQNVVSTAAYTWIPAPGLAAVRILFY
jgi:hypothetical protein